MPRSAMTVVTRSAFARQDTRVIPGVALGRETLPTLQLKFVPA
jgi:hypothetical protein